MSAVFVKCYLIGSLVRLLAEFKDADGVLMDPDEVKIRVLDPSGNQTTKVYLTDAEVIKDADGMYHYDLDASAAGTWAYRWEGSGTGQAAAEHTFTVTDTAFTLGSP